MDVTEVISIIDSVGFPIAMCLLCVCAMCVACVCMCVCVYT